MVDDNVQLIRRILSGDDETFSILIKNIATQYRRHLERVGCHKETETDDRDTTPTDTETCTGEKQTHACTDRWHRAATPRPRRAAIRLEDPRRSTDPCRRCASEKPSKVGVAPSITRPVF